MRNKYKLLIVKPQVKLPLARSRRRWEDNIKIDKKQYVIMWTGNI
jgi:hypothetical protein